MADLNALIAQGAQFAKPIDPFAQYAQMQQLEQGQQANALNRMKMDEYQRSLQSQNAMRSSPAPEGVNPQHWAIDPVQALAIAKEQAAASAQSATAKYKKAQTTVEGQKWMNQAKRDLAFNPSPENIKAYAQDAVLHEFMSVEEAQSTADQLLKMSPEQLRQVLTASGATAGELRPTITSQNLGGAVQAISTPAFGGPATVVPGSVGTVTITPAQAEATRIAEARMAQSERLAEARLNQGERRISIAEEKANKPSELKQVPVHAQKAIVGAATAIQKLDDAIAAMEGKAGEEATGWKGYLPDAALNRVYPKGTEARAAVADIGSLVMHERSGAAVTASESPRLKPFIPLITDDKATALKKLKRMRQIQADDAEALAGTYTPEQGFREFKTPDGKTPPAPKVPAATGGLSAAEQSELEQLRARFGKR